MSNSPPLRRHLTPAQEQTIKELEEFWKIFDKDGNGEIEFDELKEVMHTVGRKVTDEQISDAEVLEMLRAADLDGNGSIDFKEFVRIITGGKITI